MNDSAKSRTTSDVERIEKDGYSASIAKERATVQIWPRLDHGRVVTIDEGVDILLEERRKLHCQGQDGYEKRIGRTLFQEVADERGDTTPVYSGEQDADGVPNRSPTLALVPPQVPPQYVAKLLAELHRIRAELCVEKAEVERLKSALARPFARLDATAVANSAETNEE